MEKELIFEKDLYIPDRWVAKHEVKQFTDCTEKEKIIYGVDKKLKEKPVEMRVVVQKEQLQDSLVSFFIVAVCYDWRSGRDYYCETFENAKKLGTMLAKYDVANKLFRRYNCNKFKDFDSYIKALEEGLEKE